MANWQRKRVTVDVNFQGRLCLRVAIYWTVCAGTVCMLMLGREMLENQSFSYERWFSQYGQPVIASFLVLPLVLLDSLVFSNRVAGPMYRLRKSISELAEGQPVTPLHMRPGDFYTDVAHNFNRLIEREQEQATEAPTNEECVMAE